MKHSATLSRHTLARPGRFSKIGSLRSYSLLYLYADTLTRTAHVSRLWSYTILALPVRLGRRRRIADCNSTSHTYSCTRAVGSGLKLIVSQRLSHQNAAGRRRRCCWHWRLAWTFCPGPYWPAPSALGYPPACRWSSARQPAHGLGRRRPPPTSLEPRLAAAAPSDAAQRPRGGRQPRVPPGRPPRVEAQ